jgi:hypothetical protein
MVSEVAWFGLWMGPISLAWVFLSNAIVTKVLKVIISFVLLFCGRKVVV